MGPQAQADKVCPYEVEQELESRYEKPLEELREEIRRALEHDLTRFDELMELVDLDTAAYWEEDWVHFERFEWAKPD